MNKSAASSGAAVMGAGPVRSLSRPTTGLSGSAGRRFLAGPSGGGLP